ncbi:Crp/Fnr family transcriptional regulator [Neorhizobium sp. T25_27]|uniref:Crp/Fnr family transcriptional regulator n=1 Tax=Neorhizobium sp. T25_27 TaxID=2093831 RepID=UPI000CFA4F18|nr:Crp/Fnr family transcriptional regulator [Neorhizobium sp. T25_27]
MDLSSQDRVRNLLLRAADPDAFAILAAQMAPVDLPLRLTLVEKDTPNEFVYFLERGLASVVAITSDEEMVEVGHIGYEGAAGLHTALHVDQSPSKTFMQGEGHGYKVPVAAVRSALAIVPSFRALLLRYIHCCNIQLSYTALANARFSIYERLARWLLMCHDRLGDDLGLTHEFLSIMLGVRRSGITDQLHLLEGIGAVKSTRGNIRIVDRGKLQEIAGGSYGVAEGEYERLIGYPIRIS